MHTTSGGRESQGANLCHKCGWPFPNPHPSAKQRRAHKKVCGTIEGYKLVGSDSENDDRLSDDDRKTLSPKLAEKSDSEKRTGGIDGRSNRSEDEVFSDAVTEFPDSGFSPGNEEGSNDARVVTADVEKSGKKDLTVFYSFNDNAIPGTIEPSSNRTGSSQIKNTEFHKTGTTLTGSNLESQVHVSSSTEESAAILTGDKSQLACDIQPLEPVIPIHASQENKAINAGADVSDSSMTYAAQETDAKGKNEMNPVSSVAPFSPCEYPGRTSEAEFKCQQIEKMTSDLMSATEDVVSKEEQGAEMASNMSWGATVESVELSDASDTAHNKLCAEQGLNSASPVTSLDDFSGKGEGNENVYELAVPTDISTARHSVFMLEEFKDYKGVKLHKSVTLDSCEINNDKKDNVEDPVLEDHTSSQTMQLSEVSKASASDEGGMPVVETPSAEGERGEPQIRLTSNEGKGEGNENVYELAVPADISTARHSVFVLEEFKDYKGVKLHKSVTLDSCEINNDKKYNVEDPVLEDHTSSQTMQLSEVSKASASDEGGMPVVETPSSEGERGEPQIRLTSNEEKGEGNENVYELAVPADISTARHSVFVLEEFKDYKGVKLHKSVTLDSCEINNDKKDNVEDPVLEDHTSSQTTQLSEVSKASASDEGSMPVVETPSAEGERGEPQIRLTSNEGADECGGPACAVKMGMEQSSPVSSMEKLQPSDVSDNSLHIGVRETAMKVSYDVNPIVAPSDANAIDLHDAGNPGNLTTEMYNGVGKVKKGRVEAEDYKNNIVTTSCSATIPPEFQVTPAISLHESDDAGDHEKDKIEKCDGVGLKSKQEPPEGKLQLETAFESNSSPHENPPVAEDIMGVSVKNLPQTVLTNLNDVSDIQNVSKLPEVKGDDKAQAECYVEHGRNVDMLERTSEYNAIKAPGLLLLDTESSKQAVTKDAVDMSLMNLPETKLTSLNEASDTWVVSKQPEVKGSDRAQGDCDVDGRNVDSLERTSEDHATKATCLLPSDTESSMQGSVVDDDNYAREHGSGHSGINQSSRGENDANNFVKHHFGASVTDTLVDSLSQTDSLEGNWGSVSVLSTQSDMQAFVDAETSPSTAEAEKLNLKKPEGTTEREHSEKSDIFEAPSFMTLVEPGGRSDQKVAASYIEKTQNLEQQKASSQTGWFPTLTNVVNESQGRKKNEEIIAKVTNWSTGKQHTSLKNLLGEANIETKPKSPSPNPRESKAPPVQKDETMAKEKSAVVTTASTILSSELPTAEPAKRETGTELNSPARYPADIKRDRRKGKGWVHFVCCSSVN